MIVPPWRIDMLGRLRATRGALALTRFQSQKNATLLAYLAFYPTHQHTREELLALLWPESDPLAARNRLRVALSSLRHQLEPPDMPACAVLIADRMTVRLNPDAFTTDVAAFEAALHAALQTEDESERARLLTAAVESYTGDLLSGHYEEWALRERERLAQSYLQALRRLVRCMAGARDYERALEYARRAVQSDTLREEAHRDMMRLYVAIGQPSAALQQYAELERLLKEALQTSPSAVTRQLAAQIAQGAGHAHPGGRVPLAPPDETASMASVSVQPSREEAENHPETSSPLPIPLTRFFGRESELERLAGLLIPVSERLPQHQAPDIVPRLVTLTGPGGAGKTRLSMETAFRLRAAFAGRAWFVPLASLADGRQILEAICQTLHLPQTAQSDPMAQLHDALSNRSALLILDNFEHLMEEGTPLLAALLEGIPTLTCLVTSRRTLGVAGERELPLFPLPVPSGMPFQTETQYPSFPSPAQLMECASVQLFVDRARAVLPDFQVTPRNAAETARVCQRLEGLPLAIELAAARARTLTPGQMWMHLEHRFDLLVNRRAEKDMRHRSLRAAMEWSYRLLLPEERRLFARLSVFQGGWTLQAAQNLCDDHDILEGLEQLQMASLVMAEEAAGEMRFRMLEMLREFAAEQRDPAERDVLARRHARYFLALAEEVRPHLRGAEQSQWLDLLEREQENLRGALDWCLQDPESHALGVRLFSVLYRFWLMRAGARVGYAYAEALLALPEVRQDPALHAEVLKLAGNLAFNLQNLEEAQALHTGALELYRALQDPSGIAYTLGNLGNVAMMRGDHAAALTLFEESLSLHREDARKDGMAVVLNSQALANKLLQDYPRARTLFEESTVLFREQGDLMALAMVLGNLGLLADREKEYRAARSLHEESLAIYRKLGNRAGIAAALNNLASAIGLLGDYARSHDCLIEALRLCRELGMPLGIANTLAGFSTLAFFQAEWERAARYATASTAQRQRLRIPLPPAEEEDAREFHARLRKEMGEAEYEIACRRGRNAPLEEILAEILTETEP